MERGRKTGIFGRYRTYAVEWKNKGFKPLVQAGINLNSVTSKV
jgi:hypothetical protein